MNLLVSLIKVWTAVKIVTFSSVVRFSFPNKRLLTFSGLKFLVDRNSAIPTCSCSEEVEDAEHYFFRCSHFIKGLPYTIICYSLRK